MVQSCATYKTQEGSVKEIDEIAEEMYNLVVGKENDAVPFIALIAPQKAFYRTLAKWHIDQQSIKNPVILCDSETGKEIIANIFLDRLPYFIDIGVPAVQDDAINDNCIVSIEYHDGLVRVLTYKDLDDPEATTWKVINGND